MQVRQVPTQERLFHLSRQFRPRQRAAGGLLEIAPWIDVVLVMLLFFITQSATLKKPGLQVDLPYARPNTGARYDAHVLTVPQDGVFFFADQRVPWAMLGDRLRETVEREPGAELILEADASLSHRTLIGIYNLAVDAGWKHIVLATRMDAATGVRP